MKIVYCNHYFDTFLRTPSELLDAYSSMTLWCESLHSAGATEISVVQGFHGSHSVEHHSLPYYFVASENALIDTIVSMNPDVIHLNGSPDIVGRLRKQLPLATAFIWQDHGGGFPGLHKRLRYKKAFSQVDGFFFTARELSTRWVERGLISPTKPVYEIIESSTTFIPPSIQNNNIVSLLVGDPVFLWVGRLNDNKDPLTVIKGFARARPYLGSNPHLYFIYSESELLTEVQALIKEIKEDDRIHLLGTISNNELHHYYSIADYFVLGSHHEGSGYALLEALACGSTPIVTNIPSFNKITGNGLIGGLWEPGSHASFAQTLLRITKDKPNRETIISYFQHHLSPSALGNAALNAYRQVWETRKSKI